MPGSHRLRSRQRSVHVLRCAIAGRCPPLRRRHGSRPHRADRIRCSLVVRDMPRSVLPAARSCACDRAASDRDEYSGGIRAHPVLDGGQRLGSAGGEPWPVAARTGAPRCDLTSSAGSPPSSTIPLRGSWTTSTACAPSGARSRPEPAELRGPVLPVHPDQRFLHPGPIDHPNIPISLAGVNPRMAAAAGEAADGFNVHPMHSPGYLREVIRPALAEGARKRAGRRKHSPW